MTADQLEKLVSLREVASLAGIHPDHLRAMVRRGDGPKCVRIGSLYKFRPSDIAAWLSPRVAA